VEPNHVYIIPPNRSLTITRGTLRLMPRLPDRVLSRTIDSFFESLAKDQKDRAVGVILSGNATDGTLGLEAIKAEGGYTFAQDASARYDSMPRSAAAAGCVDMVLSPSRIARELARMAKHPYVRSATGKSTFSTPGAANRLVSEDPDLKSYEKIMLLLRNHRGVDFSLYKSSTIHRRISRRTVLNRLPSLSGYVEFLGRNPKELDALYSDALISVTSFFRNADAFAAVQRKVFANLLQQGGSEPLRVWVLGCSTGQEAYSLAMAFAESAEKVPRARKLQIFATDLNEANLSKARHGLYARGLLQDISPQRLKRFFIEEKDGYRVVKTVREQVVFARQNVISDPPFSRMDLISCRNLLIYLDPALQKRVLANFHNALKPDGFLFLGASESISGFQDLFLPVDAKYKIFSRKAAKATSFQLPLGEGRTKSSGGKKAVATPAPGGKRRAPQEFFRSEVSAEREADRLMIDQFAPPSVLVNAALQILQFRGPTGAYLEPPTGKASFDLLRMARPELMLPLRGVIAAAAKSGRPVRRENVSFKQGSQASAVNIEVIPLKNLKERCFLVVFEAATKSSSESKPRRSAPDGAEANRVAGLEKDLSDTRDYLQSVQEHQETANAELQVSNEEGQSANEELQSLNEELETSKEELESTNEELTTVNEEMASRNNELHRLMEVSKVAQDALRQSDTRYRALFDLGPVAVYSCDAKGAVREFNRGAAELWGRRPRTGEDGDKFCGSIKLFNADGTHVPHARCPMAAVLKGEIPVVHDLEVMIERPDRTVITVIVNIVPLKNERGVITGAINCFYDITDRKLADEGLRTAQMLLSRHAKELESQVAERTSELTSANRRLETSIRSVKKGNDEYKVLLAGSRVMQEKLRELTRQIITVQEDERKVISRELHDVVVQTLIGINVELTNLYNAGALGGRASEERIAHVKRLVTDSVTEVHRFARGLRPAVLDDLGLIPALHAHCKSLVAQKKLNIQVTAFGGVEALDDVGKTVLFRVAQEALTNVVRHARATQVKVSIAERPGAIRMEISDNGQAFRVEKVLGANTSKRLGLIGMTERIEMVGGRFTIESVAGTGTTVRADIPFNSEGPKT
jgi:chemotaxis methyl-accepting protein methylase/signal transduction histidine kinase